MKVAFHRLGQIAMPSVFVEYILIILQKFLIASAHFQYRYNQWEFECFIGSLKNKYFQKKGRLEN